MIFLLTGPDAFTIEERAGWTQALSLNDSKRPGFAVGETNV